jgi:ABC-type multidrug transport system fused ATPase/permease subunit
VVAHRLSTVQHADRIFVMEGGSVVEEGRFDELIARGGLFSQLAARQLV